MTVTIAVEKYNTDNIQDGIILHAENIRLGEVNDYEVKNFELVLSCYVF